MSLQKIIEKIFQIIKNFNNEEFDFIIAGIILLQALSFCRHYPFAGIILDIKSITNLLITPQKKLDQITKV